MYILIRFRWALMRLPPCHRARRGVLIKYLVRKSRLIVISRGGVPSRFVKIRFCLINESVVAKNGPKPKTRVVHLLDLSFPPPPPFPPLRGFFGILLPMSCSRVIFCDGKRFDTLDIGFAGASLGDLWGEGGPGENEDCRDLRCFV